MELRWKVANEADIKKAEGLPKCNYDDPNPFNYFGNFEESFKAGLQSDNDSFPEMENPFPEATPETGGETYN